MTWPRSGGDRREHDQRNARGVQQAIDGMPVCCGVPVEVFVSLDIHGKRRPARLLAATQRLAVDAFASCVQPDVPLHAGLVALWCGPPGVPLRVGTLAIAAGPHLGLGGPKPSATPHFGLRASARGGLHETVAETVVCVHGVRRGSRTPRCVSFWLLRSPADAGASRQRVGPSRGRSQWPASSSVPRASPHGRDASPHGRTDRPEWSEPFRHASPCERAPRFPSRA